MTFAATRQGPGISADSISYLAAGANLANGLGLTQVNGATMTVFPPGLSVVAAIGEAVGIGPQIAVRVICAVSAAIIVLLGHRLLSRLPIGERMLLASTVILGLSPVVLSLSTMALSEAPFVAVSLAFLLVLGQVFDSRELTFRSAAALCLLCWAGFLLRYSGVSLIPAMLAVGLAALRPWNRSSAIRLGALAFCSITVPAAWLLRNHSADGTLMGPRFPSPDSPLAIPPRLVGTAGKWILPADDFPRVVIGLIGAIGCCIVAAGMLASWRQTGAEAVRRESLIRGLAPAIIFSVVYVVQLVLSQISTAIDPIGPRLLAPVFVPWLMVATVALSALGTEAERRGTSPRLLGIATGLLVALPVTHVTLALRDTIRDGRDGIVYNATVWRESPLARATAAIADDSPATVFTNEVGGLWSATGLQPLYGAPRFAGLRGLASAGELDRFAQIVGCSDLPVLLALYTNGDWRALGADEIRRVVNLESVATANDGTLYRVTTKASNVAQPCSSPQPSSL